MSKGLQYKNGSLSVSMGETGNTTTIAASNYNLTTTTGENGTTVITLAFNKTLFVDAATRKIIVLTKQEHLYMSHTKQQLRKAHLTIIQL